MLQMYLLLLSFKDFFFFILHVLCFQTGELLNSAKGHTKQINDIQPSKDGNWFITASKDFSAKVKMIMKNYSHMGMPHFALNKDDDGKFSHGSNIFCLEMCSFRMRVI